MRSDVAFIVFWAALILCASADKKKPSPSDDLETAIYENWCNNLTTSYVNSIMDNVISSIGDGTLKEGLLQMEYPIHNVHCQVLPERNILEAVVREICDPPLNWIMFCNRTHVQNGKFLIGVAPYQRKTMGEKRPACECDTA
jgi:hypothetical protein